MKSPSFRQALAMLGLYMGFQFVFGTALQLLFMIFQGDQSAMFARLAVESAASMAGTVWLATRILRVSWRSLLTFGLMPWRLVPAVVLMGLGSCVLCSEVGNLTRMVL